MAVRVTKHGGDHTWVLVSSKGVCYHCMEFTNRRLPMKMKWECNVQGCNAKKTTRHQHVV